MVARKQTPYAIAKRQWRNGPNGTLNRAKEATRRLARAQALSALARKYPAEYMALYEAELEFLGYKTLIAQR